MQPITLDYKIKVTSIDGCSGAGNGDYSIYAYIADVDNIVISEICILCAMTSKEPLHQACITSCTPSRTSFCAAITNV